MTKRMTKRNAKLAERLLIAIATVTAAVAFFFLTSQVHAAQITQATLSPSALQDLQTVVAFSNQLQDEPGTIQDVVFVPGLKDIRSSCQQARQDDTQLLAFKQQIYNELYSKSGTVKLVYTPPAQAAPIIRDEKMIPMLNKSIHSQISSILGQLPSQLLVTAVLNQTMTASLREQMTTLLLNHSFSSASKARLQGFTRQVSNLKLNDPYHVVKNAKIYLQNLNTTVDGSLTGYSHCVNIVNSVGVKTP